MFLCNKYNIIEKSILLCYNKASTTQKDIMYTPKIDKQEAYIMRKLGWSCADIAYYYGCSTQAVQNATGKVKTDRNALCDFWNKVKQHLQDHSNKEEETHQNA